MNILKRLFGAQEANGKRPYQHRGKFVYRWQTLPDTIGEEYENSTVLEIANRHSTDPASVTQKLRSLGVTLRRPSLKPPGRPHQNQKLSKEQIAWALEQDDKDVSHAEIGRQLGVSRERIRQICLLSGRPNRRSRMTKTLEIKEASKARAIDRQQRIQQISDAWKAGATLKELNNTFFNYKHPYIVCHRISAYRTQYPELFPRRAKKHFFGQEQSMEEVEKISELWKAGKDKDEIAQALGYKNGHSLSHRITALRHKFPRMFPPRKASWSSQSSHERRQTLGELWRAGKSAVEIMEAMHYTNIKSVYQAVSELRDKYPDEFPPRNKK